MDVPGDDQLSPCVDERPQDGAAARDGPLAAPPGRADQVVVERDDPQGAGRCFGEDARRALELILPERPALVPPRPNGVQPANQHPFRAVDRLGLRPLPPELVERPQQPRGWPGRNVVVPGNDDERPLERAQQLRRALLLLTSVPVSQIPRGQDDLRVGGPNERN